jgi:hypothetical protein
MQLDEIFGKIFGKEEDKEEKKNQVLTAKDVLAKKKEKAEERKKELQRKRDEEFLRAKERLERPSGSPGRRDEYALHRSIKEEKTTYSNAAENDWKDDALAAGYKIKKLSGNLKDGDQTWGAFSGEEKMGEFTEKEEGRGGWLLTD